MKEDDLDTVRDQVIENMIGDNSNSKTNQEDDCQ